MNETILDRVIATLAAEYAVFLDPDDGLSVFQNGETEPICTLRELVSLVESYAP